MGKIKSYVIAFVVMILVCVIMLTTVSVCSYMYKWYADKALIGITLTYILAGFWGGVVMKCLEKGSCWRKRRKNSEENVVKEEKNTAKKMQEAILLGSLFMLFLTVVSITGIGNSFEISGRMLLIWMLLTGSACLGRIL